MEFIDRHKTGGERAQDGVAMGVARQTATGRVYDAGIGRAVAPADNLLTAGPGTSNKGVDQTDAQRAGRRESGEGRMLEVRFAMTGIGIEGGFGVLALGHLREHPGLGQ